MIRTKLFKILVGVGVLALIAAGAVFLPRFFDRSCAAGVERPDGSDECIGVTAEGYDFKVKEISKVSKAIAAENEEVDRSLSKENETAEGPEHVAVSIAVMMPFTSTAPEQLIKMRHELQGIYVQQRQANRVDGVQPKVKLLLANTGDHNDHWETTVDQLVSMVEGPERLRAVTGIATSSEQNKLAVGRLAEHGIPMVGSTITADDFADVPGLARVSPTNGDEARALVAHTKNDFGDALLVHDTRPSDRFAQTLRKAFEAQLPDPEHEPRQFTSPKEPDNPGNLGNVFNSIVSYICDTDTRTILFAGRHTPLRVFIDQLSQAGCGAPGRFTVLTGDEASYLPADPKLNRQALAVRKDEKQPRVTVKYAALAHPDAWNAQAGHELPKTGGSAAAYQRLADGIAEVRDDIGPNALQDGQTIIGYDAMATAVQGVRAAAGTSGKPPAPADITAQWPHLTGSLRVNGASGWICLDNRGNPRNKAVPIVRLPADGNPVFEQFAWPEQKPPSKDCV
ncbi:hypothetical protein AB0M39_27250 [Streptomyces sp. NPDC051907]|uniref:hypothetical protein n=1 Tax=Streptomyces sp. NPDC051907 TaxID=3155284 RepID=UPI00344A8081